MSTSYKRLGGLRRWIKSLSLLAAFAGLATVAFAIVTWIQDPKHDVAVVLPYLLSGVALAVLAGLAQALGAVLVKLEGDAHHIHDLLIESTTLQATMRDMLTSVRDNSQISDAAKSITHREYERDALRKAIREDILKEDWEAAYSLIEEMEQRFGYHLEAYNYRKEVDEFRARVIEHKLQASMRHLQRLILDRQWPHARAECQRLARLAPEDPRVEELVATLATKQGEYKAALLEQWHEAVKLKDVDRAIELLREIDPLLTRDESAALEDSAREIFKGKLVDLGSHFKSAVTERRWTDAIEVGQQIQREFPNSLMAKEVGDTMETLRTKADAATAA